MTALHALCAAIAAHEPGLFELIYGRLVYHGESKDGMDAQPIVVVAGVRAIEGDAFSDCTSLVAVKFPAGLQVIGRYAFAGCTSLVAVEFPDSLKTIGEGAFVGCTSLVAVEFPGGLQKIDSYAFLDCTSLQGVMFPNRPKICRYGFPFDARVKIHFLK